MFRITSIMDFNINFSTFNIGTSIIIQSILPHDLLFPCTVLGKTQLDSRTTLDPYKVSRIEGENKVFIPHLFPSAVCFVRHRCFAWQPVLLRIRHIDGNKIVAVVLHIKYVDPHHAAVGRDAVSNRQSHRGLLTDVRKRRGDQACFCFQNAEP